METGWCETVEMAPFSSSSVRKSTRWLFHCFYEVLKSRFYFRIFSNHTFCTLLFVNSSSESSKTPYRFAPLNISVVLFSCCILPQSLPRLHIDLPLLIYQLFLASLLLYYWYKKTDSRYFLIPFLS